MDKYHIVENTAGRGWNFYRNGEFAGFATGDGADVMAAAWLDSMLGPLSREDHEKHLRGLTVPECRPDEFEAAERAVGRALVALRQVGTTREGLSPLFPARDGSQIIGHLQQRDRLERLEALHRELGALRHALSGRPATGIGGSATA